jgi:L-histidine N-alpha-methyltransferase
MSVPSGTPVRDRLTLYDFEPTAASLCEEVLHGLTLPEKKLSPKWFYDEAGARLFERISGLDEYYPTRTEIGILQRHAQEITSAIGPERRVVEFGSGSGIKTMLLLEHMERPTAYVPVDIAREQLLQFALAVAERFPELQVQPVCADYTTAFQLPALAGTAAGTTAFFPGSTIGNFEPAEAARFLRQVRGLCGAEGGLVIGVDRKKDKEVLIRAYNDEDGVTAAFNRNLLERINRECGANFAVSAFRHQAIYDEGEGRIEMRLVSSRAQQVRIGKGPDAVDPVEIGFRAGEHITTEYSYKYDLDEFAALASRGGWEVGRSWSDRREWFSVLLLHPA